MMGVTAVTSAAGAYLTYIDSSFATYSFVLAAVSIVAAFLSYKLSPGISSIVVMSTHERTVKEECASITGAVRELRDTFGLTVIVDGTPNSLDDSLFNTTRQGVFYIQPLTKEEILSLPQFQLLPEEVQKDTELRNIIWEVMGGILSKYDNLLHKTMDRSEVAQKVNIIKQVLTEELVQAWKEIRDSKASNPDMEQILALFKMTDNYLVPISSSELQKKHLRRSSPDKVLHEIIHENKFLLVPATNAIAIMLRYSQEQEVFRLLKNLLVWTSSRSWISTWKIYIGYYQEVLLEELKLLVGMDKLKKSDIHLEINVDSSNPTPEQQGFYQEV